MKRLEKAWWSLIRFGFRLLYNELAWTYDVVSRVVSLGQWRTWQRTAIPQLAASPGDRVLELAHGTANLQLDLTAAGLDAIGLDLSPYMGRIARRKLLKHGLTPRLVRGSALRLPFPAERFDAVVSTFPTEFILNPVTLGEVRRVLKPGGRLVIVFNGILTLQTPPARTLEWLYRVTGQRGSWPGDPEQAFCNAGFDTKLVTKELPGSIVLLVEATRR